MSYQSLDNRKRLVRSRSGLRVVSIENERSSPFEIGEPFWVPDSESPSCGKCHIKFDFLNRRHHCRRCGNVYCKNCCETKLPLQRMCFVDPVRICDQCIEVTKKENEFYDKHLKVLLSGSHFNLDEETGSGTLIPIQCCLSKDHQALMLDGGNLWQHNPVYLTDIVSVRVLGTAGNSGLSNIVGAVIRFFDFMKVEKELRICLTDVPNRKQSVAWIHALQKIVAGVNYKLQVRAGYTSCKKSQVKYEDLESCEFQTGPHKLCNLKVYKDLRGKHTLTEFHCETDSVNRSPIVNLHQDYAEKLLFDDFIARHGKEYKDEREKMGRFQIFQENLKKIKFLNDHEKGTARYGLTHFADWTGEEFKRNALGLRPDLMNANEKPPSAEIPKISIPDSFDWRDKKIVSEVKNQQQCGSCWAFSTTGNIEGQWALKKKVLVSLSEQELVDCDKVDQGCNGGLQTNAYKEIIRLGGLEQEQDYPYEAAGETCEFSKSKVKVYINGSVTISTNETEMAQWLVQNGPIAIGINANAMQFYYGGISHPWKFLCDPSNLDHGVLIVGYGVHTYPIFKKTLPFWIIKNSWGASWGEQGYYRVYRGDGTCGLNLMASSAVVN